MGSAGRPSCAHISGEALTARGLVDPGGWSMTEVLVPTMIDYAPPELAAEMVPRLLRGDETWCQGLFRARYRQQSRQLAVPGRR